MEISPRVGPASDVKPYKIDDSLGVALILFKSIPIALIELHFGDYVYCIRIGWMQDHLRREGSLWNCPRQLA